MRCLHGILQRLNTNEDEEADPKKAVAERARQLHGRCHAFMNGQLGTTVEQERKDG